jgi:hypothetical protein
MILIDFLCLICLLLLTFDPIKNQEKKINRKIKSKIQEDIHEENLEHCPSWWWKTKMKGGKVGEPKYIKLVKLATQFWLTKSSIGENIFI